MDRGLDPRRPLKIMGEMGLGYEASDEEGRGLGGNDNISVTTTPLYKLTILPTYIIRCFIFTFHGLEFPGLYHPRSQSG